MKLNNQATDGPLPAAIIDCEGTAVWNQKGGSSHDVIVSGIATPIQIFESSVLRSVTRTSSQRSRSNWSARDGIELD